MGVFNLEAILSLNSKAFEDGLGKAKGLASGFGNAITGGLKVAGAAIGTATAAVGAFAASSIEVGKTFDSSMSQVAATMGVTTGEIGELREFAMDMGAKTAFSATQAADALNYMALAGYDANESMEMLPNVLNLAAAGDMDLARASDMVTDAQSALGLEMKDMEGFVDQLAKTSSKSNTSVSQLGEAILTIGGTAKSLAGGTTELNTALGILADNGIKGAEGGTHLRNVILGLSAPTDKAAGALEDLGVTTKDVEGNLLPLEDIMGQLGVALDGLGTAERAEIISTIFNKTDIAAVNALIDTNAERWNELSTAIDGAWYSEQSLNEQLSAVGVSLDTSRANLEKMGVTQEEFDAALAHSRGDAQDFVKALMEVADEGVTSDDVLKGMNATVSDLYHAFDRTAGSAEQMAQTQLDNLAGDIKLWESAMEGAQLLLSGQLAPELRKFVQFGTNGLTQISDAFKSGGVSGAMDKFGEVLSQGIGMISKEIPSAIKAGVELLKALGKGIVDNAPTIFKSLVEVGNMLSKEMLNIMKDVANNLKEFDFAEATSQIINFIVESFTNGTRGEFLTVGLDILTSLVEGITESLPALADGAMQIIDALTQGISSNLPTMINTGMNALMEFSGSLRKSMGTIVDAGLKLILSLADGLIKGLPTFIQTIPTIISNIAGIINDNAPKILIAGVTLIGKLVMGIVQAVPTLIAEFPKIVKAIIDVFMAINWLNLGASVITFIGNGVKSLSASIPSLVKDIGTNAWNFFKGIDWLHLGTNLINMIVNGITNLITSVPTLLQNIGTNAWTLFKSIDWLSLGTALISFIVNGLQRLFSDVPNKLKEIGNKAFEWFKEIDWLELGTNLINKVVEGLQNLFESIGSKLKEIGDSAWEKFNSIDWASLGHNIMEGIKKGMEEKWEWLKQKAKEIAQSLLDAAKNVLGIESPSKEFAYVGRMMDEGLAKGIDGGLAKVKSSMSDLVDVVQPLDVMTNFETVGSAKSINQGYSMNRSTSTEDLTNAFVKALDKYGLTVEMDNRELGRVIRREAYV